jgi:hypothetical protein
VKKRLWSFAYLLPAAELLVWIAFVPIPAWFSFSHFKHIANGAPSVLLKSDEFTFTIPSHNLLSFSFTAAAWRAEGFITAVNAPAKFTEILVSLVVAQKPNWYPESLDSSLWHTLIYPVYALPAWFYVGSGIDAGMGRRRVSRWSMILSVILAFICVSLFCTLRFGLAPEERGLDRLIGFITGLGIWTVLFAIPFLAWLRQRQLQTATAKNAALSS